jgi:hypothetical protein
MSVALFLIFFRLDRHNRNIPNLLLQPISCGGISPVFWQPHITLPDWILMDVVQLLFPEMLTEQTLRMPAGLLNLPVTVGQVICVDHLGQRFRKIVVNIIRQSSASIFS